jgi:adenine/guanine phosphoribosyltransferase-like PRPP-binding protein
MANSEAFNTACTLLEELTELTRLEARGTVRLALKQSGLSPASVVASELGVVARKILPNELESRGIPETEQVCSKLAAALDRLSDTRRDETPESVFSRLGGEK